MLYLYLKDKNMNCDIELITVPFLVSTESNSLEKDFLNQII